MKRGIILIILCFLTACAGKLPGGTDGMNESFYTSGDVFKRTVDELEPGMDKEEVFYLLGRSEADLIHLSREEIVTALYGGRNAGLPLRFTRTEDSEKYLSSLDGYRLEYKNVHRKHGFSSLIRFQTDKSGVEYSAYLIFKNGRLMEKPAISGGLVNEQYSKTIFDYLNPGVLVSASGF